MKLAIIYDPECPKLQPEAYSQTYRDMFLSLINRFDKVQEVTEDCHADDIDADCIVFFDIHSSHHINIDGIESHSAVKYEYFNDPWQKETKGYYNITKQDFHKLGIKKRCQRALDRGVDYIVCPYTNLFYRYLAPHLDGREDDMFLWFPIAPDSSRFNGDSLLKNRKSAVLLNGHTWQGSNGFRPYHFRQWAYDQNCTYQVEHYVVNKKSAAGADYPKMLAKFAGALALCDRLICPKYSEIPLSGCVTFAQYQHDYEKMGFKGGESCIYVTKANFEREINEFRSSVEDYQHIADAGRKLMEENWTSKHFADYIYNHAKERA